MSGPVPRTLDQFRRHVTDELVQWSYRFRSPKHDWHSLMLWVQSDVGIEYANVAKVVTSITGGDFKSATDKELASLTVRRSIAEAGAYRYALITNGHMVKADGLTDAEQLRLDRGERLETFRTAFEQLTMAIGDAEDEQVWEARILRDSKRLRRLGAWSRSTLTQGRFVNVNDVLRAPRQQPNP